MQGERVAERRGVVNVEVQEASRRTRARARRMSTAGTPKEREMCLINDLTN